QTIAYDKSIRVYKKNDYIKAIIITLNRKDESLNLKIEDSEAIKYEDLPFYYRQELENKPRKMDENDDVLTCLRNNNISELLSV
uniref:Uncharacterized protein n=1 Tax=Acrobeloides nanus TaxID=290746 RepID=A0A914DDY0_9BILA